MPTREDIDGFKQKINLWGDEPAIMEALGESIEDVLPPEPTPEESLNLDELEQDELSMDDFLSQVGLDDESNESALDESDVPQPLDDLDDIPVLDEPADNAGDDSGVDDFLAGLDDFMTGAGDDLSSSDDSGADEIFSGLDDLLGGEESSGLDEPGGVEELSGLEDLGGGEELPGLEDLGGEEELSGLEDLGGEEELPGLEDLGGEEELPGLEDLGGEEELSGLEDLGTEEELPGLEDLGGEEELSGLEDLGGEEELSGLEDLGGEEELSGLEDLGGGEELSGLEDLGGEEELPGLEDLGGEEELPGLEDLGSEEELPGLEDLGGEEELPGLEDLGGEEELPGLEDLGGEEELPGLEDLGAEEELPSLEEAGDGFGDEAFDLAAPGEEFDLTSPDEEIPELGAIDEMSMDDDDSGAQFSLGDYGEEFNFQEGISFDDDMDASLDSLDTLDDTFLMDDSEEIELEEEEQFEISEEDLDSVQESLRRLPLNLKIAIQNSLAEASDLTGVRYKKLISMLIKGSSPRQINTEFFNITGKKIQLPRGYLKQSGQDFERKRSGFLYQFAEKGWPFVRLFTVILVFLGLTVYISFHFLYRPVQAHIYYNKGIESIALDEYEEGEEFFRKAYFGWSLGQLDIEGWESKRRFLEYAEAYQDRRAYPDAEKMYEGLIGEYPDFIDGYLEYGQFLSEIKGDYPEAVEILSMGLNRDLYNYDLMLALGDSYFNWSEEDPDKLEDARFQYATALSRNDGKDEILLRMLSYFLRIGDDENIDILSNIYSKKSSIKGDTDYTALVLSELGGYYIDRNQVSDAKDLLFKAEEVDVSVPDVHYQLARYFRRTYNTDQEKRALQKALFYMDQTRTLSRTRIARKIGIYRRRGEISYSEGNFQDAEVEYEAGIRLLEDSQVRGLIGSSPELGELYADMGTLHYEIFDDLDGALSYYELAEKNLYENGGIAYRKGVIHYSRERYDRAVLEFEKALENAENDRNTRFALANTMVHRRNLFGARSQYMELLRDLKREENSLPYLAPEDILEHRSLVRHFIQVYNNLAYVDYALSQRNSDPSRQSQALLSLTKAADYADRLDRDPETMERSRPEDNLVFQNTMAVVKPVPETDIHMYDDIPRTPDELLSR